MILDIPDRKIIRSHCIKRYMQEAGIAKAVAFSCGNATRALREVGIDVLAIAPDGDMAPTRWWTPEQIRREFPDRLDATSGHLPISIMVEFSEKLRERFTQLKCGFTYEVETGSGETIVCLRWAFPKTTFMPIYNTGHHTKFEKQAILNHIINV